MTKKEIKKLLKHRLSIYKMDEKSNEVDEIMNIIVKEFENNIDNFEFDFIFETLTMFGWAPNLIYDDNGRFAVSGNGYCPTVIDKKIEGMFSVYVEKDDWKKTPKKALKRYLEKSVSEN